MAEMMVVLRVELMDETKAAKRVVLMAGMRVAEKVVIRVV